MGLPPELARDLQRLYTEPHPPILFVIDAVCLAVVATAERHRELVADLAAQGAKLSEAQVMSI